MNKDIFIKQCSKRGVCHRNIAIEYTKRFSDDHEYSEEDFEKVFRFEEEIYDLYLNLWR